ncbi:putative mitochondrial carrier protein (Rim2) [Aspergillus affinis]|uniref:putative mitochondrial carrier protein (Rim2) n=1 Tax=Aspergillus affinis TaxID=1070780 RepID=UPI0022FE4C3E|nr:mitochondrial carrier [Aspergillus affinis]KAI9038590.1 mitochondrial carrier [Aspergillus affinis]
MQALRKNIDNGPPPKTFAEASASDDPVTPHVHKATSPSTHFIAGATGGMVTALLTSPLDVLRTRLQSDFYRSQTKSAVAPPPQTRVSLPRSFLLHFRETFDILFTIHRVEGWRSLFRGLGPSLTGVVPATAIKFYAYGNCKRLYPGLLGKDADSTSVHALSAATAGVVTGTATNPIWLVKTRLQLDKSHLESGGQPRYKSSYDCVKQVVKQEGLRGLYRGLAASYLGVIETTLHLASYERMKVMLANQNKLQNEKKNNELSQGLILSGAAGLSKLIAVLIAYPHEVLRTRLRQAPMANGHPKYTGVMQCLRLMVKEEGVVALYGGLTAHLIRTVPSAAITLGTYELVLKLLN